MKITIKTKVTFDTAEGKAYVSYWKKWFWFFGKWMPWGSQSIKPVTGHKVTTRRIVAAIYDKIEQIDK